jgi:hypothetical protein
MWRGKNFVKLKKKLWCFKILGAVHQFSVHSCTNSSVLSPSLSFIEVAAGVLKNKLYAHYLLGPTE